jgi:hypothetical protein
MSLIYKFTGAILRAITLHRDCVAAYGEEFRIVSYYPPIPDRNDIHLNFADGGCVVIYPDQSIDGYGSSTEPSGELADWGEPIPWPFDFLTDEEVCDGH